MNREYDAVVVGARCAGSATALLMARAGLRVLLLDRVHPGRDTLSTHALMRAGVLQLDRWGLLDRIVAAGTPAITGTTFHYADGAEHVALAAPLYAPRRTVLDPILLDAALEAGVEARLGVDVSAVTRADTGRVTGVRATARGGAEQVVRAGLTVGADGLRSGIARAVAARPTFQGTEASAFVFGYWPLRRPDGYRWYYRPGAAAGVIPTNDGLACVWASLPTSEFATRRRAGLDRVFADVLAQVAPAVDFPAGDRVGPLRGFPGVPARLHQPVGDGWALVGDAGSFKDPLTAHGITDALRDAELLTRAVVAGTPAAYADRRDALTLPLLRVAEEIAAYRWDTPRVKDLLRAESAAMKPEVAALRALDLANVGEGGVNATWDVRDALLLAFEELSSYGVLTVACATGATAQVRFELARSLMAVAPCGLGSYAFWLEADEHHFADGGMPPLYTSGPEVDIALAAALAHQGYSALRAA